MKLRINMGPLGLVVNLLLLMMGSQLTYGSEICARASGNVFNGQCLIFHKAPKLTRSAAAEACAAVDGGRLASFDDTNDFYNYITRTNHGGEGYWTAGTDSADEGTWTWPDGSRFVPNPWRSKYPNTNPGNTYDYLLVKGGVGYYDQPSSMRRGYICELAATTSAITTAATTAAATASSTTQPPLPTVEDTCYNTKWQCSSGQCIDRRGWCDGRSYGVWGCSDGSDEKNCVPSAGQIDPDTNSTVRIQGKLEFDLFYSNQYKLTWYDALIQCRAESAQLATFSSDQYKEVLSYLSDNYAGDEFWIGYTDLDKEGIWLGYDRSESYNGKLGEIDAGSRWPWSGSTNTAEYEKNYMVVNSEGHFSDANYDTKKKYICKKDSWRTDGRCGKNFRAPNGESAVCSSCDQGGCCNATGHCSWDRRCTCDTCVDYKASGCLPKESAALGCTFCSSRNVWNGAATAAAPNWQPSSTPPPRPTARLGQRIPRPTTSRPRPRPPTSPRPRPASRPWGLNPLERDRNRKRKIVRERERK